MMVGACRKYVSWLNNGPSAPIASLHYFDAIIEEVQERPVPPGYREYMQLQVKKLARLHAARTEKDAGSNNPGRALVHNAYIQPIVARRDDDDSRTRIRCSIGANPKPEKRDQKIAMRAKNS